MSARNYSIDERQAARGKSIRWPTGTYDRSTCERYSELEILLIRRAVYYISGDVTFLFVNSSAIG